LLRQLLLLGLMPPLMLLNHAFGPSGLLAPATAQGSAFLIWITGMPAVARGIHVLLPHRVLEIGAGCTGLNTISLCLAAVVALALLFPVQSLRRTIAIAAAALVLALVINTVRVALLAFTTTTPAEGLFGPWHSFEFWHTGGGSHLFSLLAMAGVTGLYALSLLALLRRSQGGPAPRP
jgi:exosortase/archaeosortase family protein